MFPHTGRNRKTAKGIAQVNMSMEIERNMTPSAKSPHVVIGAQSNDHSAHLAGVSSKRFFTDAQTFARVQVFVTEYYRLDVLSNFWDVYNIEAEALGQKVVYHPGGIPDTDRTRPLIGTPSDLARISPPDPHKSGRLPWIQKVSKHFLEITGKLERVYFTAPFSIAVNIRGYENLVQDMFERPSFVHRLFEFLCDEVIAPFIEVMRSEVGNPDLILDGRDAWASPPMITLDMMDEYVVAYTERLRDKLGDKVITRGNWGDSKSGDIERFFSQKIRCSPGSLSVLDPDLFAVGPERVKTFANKHNSFVTAGVDATLLQKGPVEAIVERIKLYIDKMARDGRCMIHLNQIAAETPPEHIHAAVAACHAYGTHPIPDNLEDIHLEIPKRESFSEFMRKKGESINP
jgi:uroporphyrinogen-III decarboxylase